MLIYIPRLGFFIPGWVRFYPPSLRVRYEVARLKGEVRSKSRTNVLGVRICPVYTDAYHSTLLSWSAKCISKKFPPGPKKISESVL